MAHSGGLLEQVRSMTGRLASAAAPTDDAGCVDLLRALEELACAAAGLQVATTHGFAASQQGRAAEAGVPPERRSRGVASQFALARRVSPHRGQRMLGLAVVLPDELPHTYAALRGGRITEWRATLVVRETACLSLADRLVVDERVAADLEALEATGDRELAGRCAAIAAGLDPASVCERRRRAESDRRVTLRPAPDTMTHLSALLPVKDRVAVLASLHAAAVAANLAGDPRSRGQVMADTLAARVLGTDGADGVPPLPVQVNLVVADDVLLGDREEAAWLQGLGPVPAELARELVRAADAEGRAALQRLYARPADGALVAMDSVARAFPAGLARFVRLRDRVCRTPWCDAPVRHVDHVEGVAEGGRTSARNGQGLCEACNHAKQAPGWRARPGPVEDLHQVVTTTPTGHTHTSRPPPARSPTPPVARESRAERRLREIMLGA